MTEHSPSPTPERAIYGFVLYLGAFVSLVVYLVWAYIPHSWLNAIGLTYLPQKYWAIAAPTYLLIAGVFMIIFYVAYNFLQTPSLDSVHTLTDEHAKPVVVDNLPPGAIPPLGDIDISDVNKLLYRDKHKSK